MTYSPIYVKIPEWIELVEKQGTFPVNTIMEIGSQNGLDAYDIWKHYKYKLERIVVIEAHPIFAKEIADKYPKFDVYNLAASNSNAEIQFNAVSVFSENLGMSSMLGREPDYPSHNIEYSPTTVQSVRMDLFCDAQDISSIDMLKIDVEGSSFEVLEGFGNMIWNVKCIHVECEHVPVWTAQKTYKYVEELLIGKGFIPLVIKIGFPQSDSVWVKKEFYNAKWFE